MPHQCTKCGSVYPDASRELLEGCKCGTRFFYYIKQEKLDELNDETKQIMIELEKADKDQIEKDIRELTGLDKKPDEPVILDLESIRVVRPGKFEIDIVSLFSKNRPLIYKLGEGKYIIDIASSLPTEKGRIKRTEKTDEDVLEINYDVYNEDESEEEFDIDDEIDEDENDEEIEEVNDKKDDNRGIRELE